jgi:hypothetical protein
MSSSRFGRGIPGRQRRPLVPRRGAEDPLPRRYVLYPTPCLCLGDTCSTGCGNPVPQLRMGGCLTCADTDEILGPHNRRQALRCHRTTVSGCTMTRVLRQPDQRRESQDQNRRSVALNLGRRDWRERTASCWRRAMFSSTRHCRERRALRRREQRRRRYVVKPGPP